MGIGWRCRGRFLCCGQLQHQLLGALVYGCLVVAVGAGIRDCGGSRVLRCGTARWLGNACTGSYCAASGCQLGQPGLRHGCKAPRGVTVEVDAQFDGYGAVFHSIPQPGFQRCGCIDGRGCAGRCTALEVKVPLQRGRFPRHLLALRIAAHIRAHLFEHVFHLAAVLPHGGEQVLGVQAVGTRAVAGHRAGGGGKGHQGAHGSFHLCQAALATAAGAHKGVVAAGIQNHDVGGVACGLHFVQHGLRVYGAVGHLVFAVHVGTYRYQVVAALDLHAMACVVEQPRAATAQLVAKLAQGRQHAALVGVLAQNHREARLLQGLADGACVVDGVGQRRFFVGGVADHQSHALVAVGAGLGGGGDRLHQQVAPIGGGARFGLRVAGYSQACTQQGTGNRYHFHSFSRSIFAG